MSDCRPHDCPFCHLPLERLLDSNTFAVAVADAFPVTVGHTLIIPGRHTASFFELRVDELVAIWELLERMKVRLEESHQPDGYNIGVNVGEAAGQTVMHVHVHLIPRYAGDVPDPRGGVRNVIPGRGVYS